MCSKGAGLKMNLLSAIYVPFIYKYIMELEFSTNMETTCIIVCVGCSLRLELKYVGKS